MIPVACVIARISAWAVGSFSDSTERRVPIEYLESLFGPEVRDALGRLEKEIDRRRQGEPSELLDTLQVEEEAFS